MKLVVAALVLALFPRLAAAEVVNWKFGDYPSGSYIIYQRTDGFRTHVIAGSDKFGTRVEVHEGKAVNGTLQFTYWLDAQGRLVRQEEARGELFVYEPNDCRAVVGICKFLMTRHGVHVQEITSTVTPAGDGYDFLLVSDTHQVIAYGHYDLDAGGFNIAGFRIDEDGYRNDLKIVAIVLTP